MDRCVDGDSAAYSKCLSEMNLFIKCRRIGRPGAAEESLTMTSGPALAPGVPTSAELVRVEPTMRSNCIRLNMNERIEFGA